MELNLLPGCEGDISDLLDLYEQVQSRSGLSENTFNSRRIGYANFCAKLRAGRITPRTMRNIRTKLETLHEQR